MNNKRKEKVKQKLEKIRAKRIQDQKYAKETYLLQSQTRKLTNKGSKIITPQHTIGNVLRILTDIPENTVVRYEYRGYINFANIMSSEAMVILDPSVVASYKDAKFRNSRMRFKKTIDTSETEVIMV